MFGYIRLEKEELKIKEYYLFRSYYCGLCQELKQRYGHLSRLLLNYDLTFLGLFLSSLNNADEKLLKHKCLLHPLRNQTILVDNHYLAYAADLNVLLVYHKFKDDWTDDRSLVSWGLVKAIKRSYRQASQKHPEINILIEKKIKELADLEKDRCPNIDAVSHVFAQIIEGLCPRSEVTGTGSQKALQWFCYNLGKWIYLADAFNDLSADVKRNRYNPFIFSYGYQGEQIEVFTELIKAKVQFLLFYTLSQIGQAYELLTVPKNQGLLENIIFLGMRRKTENLLNQRSCEKGEKRLLRNPWCDTPCFQRRNP